MLCGSVLSPRPQAGPFLFAFVCATIFTGREAAAQADIYSRGEPVVPEKAGKVLRAERLAEDAIVIDGRLYEDAWARADSFDDFFQLEPDNMAPATERTVVRVLYDDRYVYVGIYAYDREPQRIATALIRRDEFPASDQLFIGFDPRHDHLTGYSFATNPNGLQRDFSRWKLDSTRVLASGPGPPWRRRPTPTSVRSSSIPPC